MARQARKESPSGYYHVMMRGNNREEIFGLERQKVYFIELMRMAANIEIAAFCIMDNHVHLVLKGDVADVSTEIKKINIKYAMMINREEKRTGHVFQGRFRSEEIFDDSHFLQVVRYIHNNPVKAGIVTKAADYFWSSFVEHVNSKGYAVSAKQLEFVQQYFGGKMESFIQYHYKEDYAEFLDMKEDIERYRIEAGQKIIEQFCDVRGILSSQEIHRVSGLLDELILKLLQGTKLSHRQIASLLEISASVVHTTSVEIQARKKE
ncbi:MAG: transposase [bacterium]|nr:transposase [bacterium]